MNFVAHAAVAFGVGGSSTTALGAMLPDLASIARRRPPVPRGAAGSELARGIDLHFRSDGIFHAHPCFLGWLATVRSGLERRGTARGPARAASHVGIELLLDGALLTHDATLESGCRSALALGRNGAGLEPAPDDELDRVLAHFERPGVLAGYRDVAEVAARVGRALERRPRLRLEPEDRASLADALEHLSDEISRLGPVLVLEMIERLGGTGPGAADRSGLSPRSRPGA